jgi:uncharacterized 2Fe-2S/4Fe-4S cluster protein (DUF4445 family)
MGLAIDLGTTSIEVYLVDMSDGSVFAATSGHNRQAACGDDVINRMICAEREGVQKLSRMALHTINNLIGEALDGAGGKPDQIIDPASPESSFSTIGQGAPRGICGSGIIDLISEMLTTGIIDRSGKFSLNKNHPRITEEQGETAYVVVSGSDTAMAENIIFTESDIKNLILSKGAVYADFTALLKQAGLDFSMVDRIQITGGFGRYLNIEKAVTIGPLPDLERSKFEYLGNSSIAGAYLALLSEKIRKEALQVCNAMTYIDFSTNNQFMDEFTSALFLPHTNLNDFPSVMPK